MAYHRGARSGGLGRGVEHYVVPLRPRRPRQPELLLGVAGVQQGQVGGVGDPLAPRPPGPDALSVDVHADGQHRLPPVPVDHLRPGRGEPGEVLEPLVVHRPTAEERVLAQHRRVAAQPQQLADQAEQGNLVRADVPVHPGDLVVLAVGVVVAVLGAPHLIARQQHRHAGGQQQGSQQVALQLATDGVDGRVVGRTLDAAVPGPVLVVPVPVALAVGLVVLSLVRRQVPQRETVVRGDEVDRGERPPTVFLVEVAGAGEPATEFADPGPDAARAAQPEVAHAVAVLAVPLRPQRREVAHLVATGADVPRLGDQLGGADHRVLLDDVEERRQLVDVVELPRQRRGQVEAEAVDVHVGHPVPQRVHDELQHVGVAGVEGVAAAGVVDVAARLALVQPVVGRVVDAAEAQRRPALVALGGVVVDHVEDDLDARRVQRTHHRLELAHLLAPAAAGAVRRMRGEVPQRVVAPVVCLLYTSDAADE